MIKVNEHDLAPVASGDQGSLLYEIVGRTAAIAYSHLSVAKTVLSTGATVERHYHQASDEIYLFTTGTGQMEVNEERFAVGPGDVVLIEPHDRHEVVAESEDDLEFYAITRPAFSPDDYLIEKDAAR